MSIPRSTLIAAIEAGIYAEGDFSRADQDALRKVGREATAVNVGAFGSAPGAPGCPLTQAGIYQARVDANEPTPWGFVGIFDRIVDRALGINALHRVCLLEVQD